MSAPKKSKRFAYNLESVLKVKNIREIQEQEKFLAVEKKFLEEKEKEEVIKAFQNQKYQELRTIMAPGKPIDNFQQVLMRKTHLERVKGDVEKQIQETQEAERLKEEQRQELIRAVKEKKIMEKDKDHKKGAWKKLMDKEQGKFLDDIATIGFICRSQDLI